jgi:hypothetical protein
MSEKQEEVLETQVEGQEQTEQPVEEPKPDTGASVAEDGTIKLDLGKLNKPQEDAIQEQSADDSDDTVGQSEDSQDSEEVAEEVRDTSKDEPVQNEETILEEVTDEADNPDEAGVDGSTEATDSAPEQEEIQPQTETQVELPEGLEKVVEFMNETGGDLNDYVKLNTDYSKLNEAQLIREYYETTKPHLDAEDINLLMEDFSYDEEVDEPKQIRKAKIAFKEEAAKAKNHLEGLKNKYYNEIKAGSKLTPNQQKAVDFFNRYNQENEQATKVAERQQQVFLNQTNQVFDKNFKGFEYAVGDKKYRFNVKNTDTVKETQSDINNFVKMFLDKNNTMSDARGYHKSLFTAMNADQIANHFYQQGKADAMKDSVAKAKNVDMSPRAVHETKAANGWTVRAVPSDTTFGSKLKIKTRK